MRRRRPDAPSPPAADPAAPHQENAPFPLALGDWDYRVQGLLQTDSKMSEILLATNRQGQTVVVKIACVQQRARADANRRAIHNSVTWLQQMRDHPGIAQMQPLWRRGEARWRIWSTPPIFVATLPDWPNNPDFLITEYLAGGTLSRFVGKQPLPIELALSIAHDLAQTLSYLHAHHCVHRDLKPENILFRIPPTPAAKPGQLQPVLIDFGIAARIGEEKLISGSRLWMAPELQTAYEKSLLSVDPTWDVYALGLICCYMLSGIYPQRRQHDYQDYIDYRDRVFQRLRQETANADPAWQQAVAALQQLLTQTLARDPQKRPTAAAFADAMAALLTRMGIVLSKGDPSPKFWHTKLAPALSQAQRQWWLGGLVLLVIFGVLFLALRLHSVQGNDEPVVTPPTATFIRAAATAPTPLLVAANGQNANAQKLPTATQQVTAALRPPTLPPPTSLPPTLAAVPTQAMVATPTLALAVLAQLLTPPTLIQLPPTVAPTATPLPPTATVPPSTATPTPRPPTPTRPLPTATPPPTAVPIGKIRLITPPSGVVSAQERVAFVWEITGAALAPDHCYELVFWDPAKVRDKRSPIGAGRTATGTVNFAKLRDSADSLLPTLARSQAGFDWGVRLVSCTSPQTILQDISEARHYTYQP